MPETHLAALNELLESVYQQWSLATGLTITPAHQGARADILIEYAEPISPGSLAHAQFPCGGTAKMFLNQDFDWSRARSDLDADSRSKLLYTALLHEAGHTLGLHHIEDSSAVMAMPVPATTELTDVDIAAARRLYGPIVARDEPR